MALKKTAQFERALACGRRAIECRPDFAGAHWNLGIALLLLGHYEDGWKEHEWRLRIPSALPQQNFTTPQWDGTPAPDQTILLHAEQGLGDTIQFLRYVPLARERAGRVILGCPPELTRLVKQSDYGDTEIVSRLNWEDAAMRPFDQHVPLPSLPFTLGVFEPLPMTAPYLHADPELSAAWRERLGARTSFRVGIAWAGRPTHREDRRRSIAPERLLPLLRVPGVTFYSLQIAPGSSAPAVLAEAGLIDHTACITDFADTAAFMSELDLIISADTAAVHVAGALGRPVWTLLQFVPDWRWGMEREDVLWYPTMRLFRQPARGDWESVVQKVADALATAQR